MCGVGVCFVGCVIVIDFVEIDQVRVLLVVGNVEYQVVGFGGYGSGGVDLDGIDESFGVVGFEVGFDKDVVYGNFFLFQIYKIIVYKKGSKFMFDCFVCFFCFNGLCYFVLLVFNLEECECFYVDVLGMEVLNCVNEDLVYFICGNDNFFFGCVYVVSNGLQIMDYYGFVVDSVEELEVWYCYLKVLGVILFD